MSESKSRWFCPGEYLKDELDARGWTTAEMAGRMLGDAAINNCIIDMLIAAMDAPSSHAIHDARLSEETARGIAAALGTSHQLWLNLDRAYREEVLRERQADLPEYPPTPTSEEKDG